MAFHMGTSDQLNIELRTYYEKKLLDVYEPNLVYNKFGTKYQLPANWGRVIQWRKFEPMAATTTALTEGTAGADTTFTISYVAATIDQYGQWVYGSERLDLESVDPIIRENAIRLGEAAARSLDTICREVLYTGTTSKQIEGVAGTSIGNSASMSNLTVTALRTAVRTLKQQNIPPFTFGGKRRYVAIAHPNTVYDLFSDTTLQTAMQYGYGQTFGSNDPNLNEFDIMPEVDIAGVRIFESTAAKVIASGSSGAVRDIYVTFVMGQDAYGVIDPTAEGMEHYFIPASSVDKADPLQQRWYQGWKASYAAKVINTKAIVAIHHLTTVASGGG